MSYSRKLYLPELPENVAANVIAELHDAEPVLDEPSSQENEDLKALMADVIAEEPNLLDADSDTLERWYFELDSIGCWLASQPRVAWKQAKEICPVCGSTELDAGEAAGETKLKPYVACLDCNTLLSWG